MRLQNSIPNEQMIVFLNHSGKSTHLLKQQYARAGAEHSQIYFFDTLASVSAVLKRRLPHVFIVYVDSADSVAERLIRFYRRNYPAIPIAAICAVVPEEATKLVYAGADRVMTGFGLSPSALRKIITTLLNTSRRPVHAHNEDLAEILRNQQEGILVLNNINAVILYCNNAAAAMLGSIKEALVGRRCELFYKIGQQIECTIENKESSLNVLVEAADIRWQNYPAILISMSNMSKRNAIETLMRKERFVQSLQQLSGAIAHEFAQPLQVIKLIGEILLTENVNPEYVKRLDSNCNKMSELLLNLRSIVNLQMQSYPGGEILDLQASATRADAISDNEMP